YHQISNAIALYLVRCTGIGFDFFRKFVLILFLAYTFKTIDSMASERKLKKQITGAISEVFTDAFLLKLFVKEEKNAEVETILNRILQLQDTTITKIRCNDGKHNPALVKKYYRRLVDDFKEELSEIVKSISACASDN
ncbi:hypothetical protein HMPREF1554_01068, partial [Porphyromonas gingivalis F0569]